MHRPVVKLPTLSSPSGAGWKRAEKNRLGLLKIPPEAPAFSDAWNAPDVRGALYAMHGRICVYCGIALPFNDRGDVEHFRPKSLYSWLAYDFSNYFLSCSFCNRISKRDEFPLEAAAARAMTATECAREQRLLLDPEIEPFDQILMAEWKDPLCRILPQDGLTPILKKRADHTIKFFQFNTSPLLVKGRRLHVTNAMEALDKGEQDKVIRMSSHFEPFGLAIRCLLKDLGVPLPSAAQELNWWLEDLHNELQFCRDIHHQSPVTDLQDFLAEVEHALATLWHSPPPHASIDIAAWLRTHALDSVILPRYQALS